MATKQVVVGGYPYPGWIAENATNEVAFTGQAWVVEVAAVNANVTLTGVSSTSAVGTPGIQQDASITLTGVSSTSAVGTSIHEIDPSVTGVAAISAIGSLTVQLDASITLTGVAATTAVGAPTIQADGSITLTAGVAATSAVGTAIAEVDHAVTGVAGTSAVGTPSVELDESLTLTGVASNSAVSTPVPEIDHSITGVSATGAVGTPAIERDASVTLTGVAATSAVGDPTRAIPLTGVVATPLVGQILGAGTPVIGVEADIAIGSLSVDIIDGAIIDGVSSTVTLGTLALQEDNNPSIVGVQTSLGLGVLHSVVEPVTTGVEATGEVGEPIPTNMQLPGTAILVELGTIGVSADNAVLVGLQSLVQVGLILAISTGNFINVAVTGVSATPAVGTLIAKDGIAISGVEADSAIGSVTVGTAVSTGLVMTDIQIEAILDLRDDFSVTLRWSDTDGYSWSDSAIRSIGQTGNYLCNPQWRRLGMSRRGRVYELSWSCPQATALQGATITYEDAST